ncbi:indoleamine 2, 3-dioxyganeseb [Moniliophthora roreri]|uniref:Putative Indoleamine 2,3-dioxygenase n=1 Tax=Moniliophthora roreri TaxID=221103 RepID=A0A0W0FXV6_MONRR|nr:indoleamine 2, 3-dioxyganeseb [Moniliophthora roreri]
MSSEPAESTEFWNGFMETNPPMTRLPSEWESWEALPIITKPQDPERIPRARLVLVWILHFYVHTLAPQPDSEPVRIPLSLSVPLLQISKPTDQPPVLTYADGVILNSYLDATYNSPKCLFLFNKGPGSGYEQAFHLTSAQVEWEGAKAMRVVHDIVTSSVDMQTLTSQLETLTTHIHTLRETLLFYQEDLRSGILL